jgi:inosose dehydratase
MLDPRRSISAIQHRASSINTGDNSMDVTIGSAPDSWGVWFPEDSRQTPWQRFMDEIVAAGYKWTELGPYGYLPTDMAQLQAELSRRGLGVTGTFVMVHLEDRDAWPAIEEQVHSVGRTLRQLNGRFLVLIDDCYTNLFTGEQLRPERLGANAWQTLVDTTQRVGEVAREYDLTVVYHPHADTHIQDEDQIEALLDQTDPELVQLCLDTGHHAYRGGDPVKFFSSHADRIPYLHLKSVDAELQEKTKARGLPFALAVAEGVFCEPSQGAVDFRAFRDALARVNYRGWAIVEQDMFPAPADKPLPIARRTRAYLRELGIG